MKTIFKVALVTMNIIISALFVGALQYCIFMIIGTEDIGEVIFWSALLLIFTGNIYRSLDSAANILFAKRGKQE